MDKIRFLLTMKRGAKEVFIGGFSSLYRIEVIVNALEWDGSWKPVIEEVQE